MTAIPSRNVDDYEAFCDAVMREAGIDLHQYKRQQMERRVRAFAERRGASTLLDYCSVLAGNPAELTQLLDRITINVSQLFRNPEQWEMLRGGLFAELAARSTPVRAWSAGCSYGAEAYSLAALAAEMEIDIRIHASDIDKSVLAKAAKGEFTLEDARSAPQEIVRRWFIDDGAGRLTASRDLRRRITFSHENLLKQPPRHNGFDLIMCRNVVIYFTQEAREKVHDMLARSLRPSGLLMVGNTERVTQDLDELGISSIRPFIYRKA